MTLTLPILEQFKQYKDSLNGLTEDENLYMNYLFFYLMCDRDRCQYHAAKDALVVVNEHYKPRHVVQVSNLKVSDYVPNGGLFRKDTIRRKMESLPLENEQKIFLLNSLQKEIPKYTEPHRYKLEKMFKNHISVLSNKPKEI